jgi:NodT family efflux transporter outer membrane factor (OMF) lipoprotein
MELAERRPWLSMTDHRGSSSVDRLQDKTKHERHCLSGVTIGRRIQSIIGLLAIGFLLSGCTSVQEYVHNKFKVGPNYNQPTAAVAPDWIDAADQRLHKQTDDLSQWWRVFNDTTLDGLITDACRQNLTLREAGYRVLQARAERDIAVGTLFPQTQDATGAYTRNALTAAGANVSQFNSSAKRFFGQSSYGFNVAWELDFWGRYRRTIESANANLDVSVASYDDALVTLLGDVADNYVNARTLEDQIKLARANVDLQRRTLEIAEARFKGGKATKLDVDQARSTLTQTESQIPLLERLLRRAHNQLCILLGIPPEDLRSRLGAAPIPIAPPEVTVGIPADLLRRRPDVRRAASQAAAQCARIGIAESDFYPRISLSGTVGYTAEHFNKLFGPAAFQGTFGPSFTWEVLNYGRILNNVRSQSAQFQALVAGYQNTVLTANAEVENGIIDFIKSRERVQFLAESVEAAQSAVNIALAQYEGGTVDFNRVALLEQNLVQQQDLLAQARGEIAHGLIEVYRALGGGWEVQCTDTMLTALPTLATQKAPEIKLPPPTKPVAPFAVEPAIIRPVALSQSQAQQPNALATNAMTPQ